MIHVLDQCSLNGAVGSFDECHGVGLQCEGGSDCLVLVHRYGCKSRVGVVNDITFPSNKLISLIRFGNQINRCAGIVREFPFTGIND